MLASLTFVQQILAVASGVAVGFSLGLIGGGGSILAVPLLLYLVGYPDAHVVIGTTALAVGVTAYLNLLPHWRAGNVRWRPGIAFALPGILGATAGSTLGKILPGKQLLFLFALLMLAVAGLMLRRLDASLAKPAGVTRWGRLLPTGFGVGLLSGFFGIGGGFLIVPGLIFATDMSMLSAVGTSLFSVGTFGVTTAASYALSGLVDWRVAAEYIVGGFAGGLLGAAGATRLGDRKSTLTRVFAAVIVVVAVYVLYVNIDALTR
ncbi:MAG TPA: sulfite exporter TauE/SafE family protein [Chloroflexota bacterium]|nr:sulfite exporter TauE/SafE family protein [Chloroflexota bacterium]